LGNRGLGNTVQVNVKKCSKCGEVRHMDEFHVDKRTQTGRKSQCKFCVSKRMKEYTLAHAQENRDRAAAWRQANPERARKQNQELYLRDRQERIAYQREWRKRNPGHASQHYHANREQYREANRKWYQKNPKWSAEKGAKRRAQQEQNGVYVITERDLARLYASSCAACGSTESIEIDHIIPINRGGQHSIGNLQPLCRSCNASKNDRLPVEWRHAAMKTLAA
jgi:5-methylcytosine-specific restriction endonuclease McrA